jgi:hypothetical protein
MKINLPNRIHNIGVSFEKGKKVMVFLGSGLVGLAGYARRRMKK